MKTQMNEMETSEYDKVSLSSLRDAFFLRPIFLRPIEALNLPPRPYNCLKAQNVHCIRDLVQLTRDDLMRAPNLGRKSLCEIEWRLDDIGLSLGMNDSSDRLISDAEENALCATPTTLELPQQVTLTPEQMATPIAELAIPAQYQKLIKRISAVVGSIITVQDLININPVNFAELPSVGKLYVQNLTELKKQLPSLFGTLRLPPKITLSPTQSETPIAQLVFPAQYQKLIKRISVVAGNVATAQDLINLDPVGFGELPSVGKLYVQNLVELQKQLPTILDAQSNPQITLSPTQLGTPLAQVAFPAQYQKLLKRISAITDNVATVQDLINLDPVSFGELPTVGKFYVKNLIELKKQLPMLLDTQARKFATFSSIEFREIDNILIEDIESYLWALDETKMDIALSRWGFNHEHETLEEVAIRYKNPDGEPLSRERIRQIEKPINANLLLHLTIQPKILWANIRVKMTEDLTVLLPNLAKCFATDKLFYAFIELCCQVEAGSISKIIFTKISAEIISSLFCSTPSPVVQEIIINELMSNFGYDKASAIHGIKQLEKRNKIEVTGHGIFPINIGRAEAVAHVLASHPEGLPWKDIAKIVNAKGCSSTQMDETRTTHGFNDSEYIYLCGKGAYRNLIFLDLEQFDIPKIMQHLIEYFKQQQITASHLNDYYFQTKGQRCEIEYFTLRYLVREYGEDYGLYFDGKSNVDGVSLDPDSKRITQADVIIKVLNESKVAMTMQEIAVRLKSKSAGHAGFYISNLMEEGKVVRVDKMVYTTPEKAFSIIDTNAIMQVVRETLDVKDIIVEADIFREYVNMELNFGYSKYFYAALVSTQLEELGWHRNNMLFSKSPIPYRNLVDMCKRLCDPKLTTTENAKILQHAVWLTDAVVASAIQQWRGRI